MQGWHLLIRARMQIAVIAEVHIRIASSMAAIAKLSRNWCATPSPIQVSSSSTSLLSPPSSSTAVKHGPSLLTVKKGSRPSKPNCLRKLLHISFLEHKTIDWVRSKINFRVGSTGASSGNCQETETCMVHACHTPQQPVQNHPSGHFGGWVTPWSAEEIVYGQQQSGHPCPCQNCSQRPPTKKTGRGSLLNHLSYPPPPVGQGPELN